MPTKEYPIIGFQPDLPPDTPGVIVASPQVIPTDRGFGSTTASAVASNSFGVSGPFGGFEATNVAGDSSRVFIGTSTKLHVLGVANTAVDLSGAVYNASLSQQWSFAQLGDNTLAVNKGDPLQVAAFPSGAFAAATGAPKAAMVVVAGPTTRSFAMLFDYDDGTNNYHDGAFWSPSVNSWTPSVAAQIGAIRLTDINGRITAACAYRDGVIVFKAGAMYAGQYVGGFDMWDFQRISSTVGCLGLNACCVAGDVLYFADSAGLWQFDGSYPRPMPGALHGWFAQQFTSATSENVRLTWDAPRHLVWVKYATDGNGYGLHLAFNVRSQKWTNFGAVAAATHLIGPDYAAGAVGATAEFVQIKEPGTVNASAATLRLNAFGSVYGETFFRGLRPQFLVGPADTSATWLTGQVYHGPSLRNLGAVSGALTADLPGRLDGEYQDRFVQPEFTVAGGTAFEVDRFAVDLIFTDDAE